MKPRDLLRRVVHGRRPPVPGPGAAADAQALEADSLAELLLGGTQLPGRGLRDLVFDRVEDWSAYLDHAQRCEKVRLHRRYVERLLALSQEPFELWGFNALLGRRVRYAVDYLHSSETFDGLKLPNYRERLVCSETGFTNRVRAALLALRHLLGTAELGARSVYLTEQLTPLFQHLRSVHPGTIGSEYLGPELAPGTERGGLRHEDVTRLSFSSASLDVVICNDVLEHVPDYPAALGELARVLRAGGLLLFTVPFATSRRDHLTRARLLPDGSVEHLLPPELHGDPVHPDRGILSYRVFGWRLLDELRGAGFRQAGALLYWSLYHGLIGGQEQLVLYAVR